MADRQASKPLDKVWTFVNSKGEEEDVDYESSCSSSSSSEFVKIGGEAVSYHHQTRNTPGSEVSSSSDDEQVTGKEASPVPVKGTNAGISSSVRNNSPLPDSSAEIVDPDVDVDQSEEEMDSDLEIILNHSQEVLSESQSDSLTDSHGIADKTIKDLPRLDDLSVDTNTSSSASLPKEKQRDQRESESTHEVADAQLHGPPAANACQIPPSIIPPPSSEKSGEILFVLRPRLESTSDSDSDFSHLESHSSRDQSEPDEIPPHLSEEELVSSVGEGFRFVADKQLEPDVHQEEIHGNVIVANQQNEAVNDIPPVMNVDYQGEIRVHEEGQACEECEHQGVEDLDHGFGHGRAEDRVQQGLEEGQGHPGILVDQGDEDQGHVGYQVHNHDDDLDDVDDGYGDVDTATESGVEDDRIESDQSDGVPADEDNDLSFSNVGLENISLHEINQSRQYVHKPNKYLSGTLSLMVILAGWMALGLGIGHSFGSTRPSIYLSSRTHSIKIDELQNNLYLCLRRKTDVLAMLKREREDWQTQEDELRKLIIGRMNNIDNLEKNILDLKVKLNDLEQQRVDLAAENGRLKYNEHPANKISVHIPEVSNAGGGGQNFRQDQEKDTELEVRTKRKIKQEVSESREIYDSEISDFTKDSDAPHDADFQDDSEPNSTLEWENQTEKLREELTVAKDQANMWQLLYLQERQRKVPASNSTPDLLSCLALFSPKINFSEVMEILNSTFTSGIQNLPNITSIKSFINRTLEAEKLYVVSEIQTVLEEVTNLWLKWRTDNKKTDQESKSESFEKQNQENQRAKPKWKKNMQDFFNKTQESVSLVSQEIKKQWKAVKNFSSDFLKKHKDKVDSLHSNVLNTVSTLTSAFRDIKVKTKSWFNHRKLKKWSKKCKGHGQAFCESLSQLLDQVRQFGKYKYKSIDKRVSENMVMEFIILYQHEEFTKKYFGMKSLDVLSCQVNWWTWNGGMILKEFSLKPCAKFLSKWQVKRMKKFGNYPPIYYETEQPSQKASDVETQKENDKKVFKMRKSTNGDDSGSFGSTKRRKNKSVKIPNEDHKKPNKKAKQEDRGQRKSCHKYKDKRMYKREESLKGDKSGHGHRFGSKHRQGFGHKHDHGFDHRHRHGVKPKHSFKHKHESFEHNLQQEDERKDSDQNEMNVNKTERGIPGNGPSKAHHHGEDSWYIRKMKAEEKHREDNHFENNTDENWLFVRAEERDFHRKRPDNWYFRRADGKRRSKYCYTKKAPEKLHPHQYNDDYFNQANQFDDYHNYQYNTYDFLVCY